MKIIQDTLKNTSLNKASYRYEVFETKGPVVKPWGKKTNNIPRELRKGSRGD